MQNEFRFIERLKRLIPRPLQGRIPIGDDAGVLSVAKNKSLLFTTDVIVEGVDFIINFPHPRPLPGGEGRVRGRVGPRASPEAIGHKALAVNLSDIAAMGGKPSAFVVAWGIPKRFSQDWVERVARGMVRLARQFNVQWVGGDLSRSEHFFISIALLGEQDPKKIIRRSGAKPGDFIYVTGSLGGSILGKHLHFIPRLAEGQYLAKNFSPASMIDVSDGFIQDLGHLLTASRVGAKINLECVPVSGASRRKARDREKKALEFALSDGEDFELLFTISQTRGRKLEKDWRRRFPRVLLTRVGSIVSGRNIEWFMKGKKIRLWFRKKGFTHF